MLPLAPSCTPDPLTLFDPPNGAPASTTLSPSFPNQAIHVFMDASPSWGVVGAFPPLYSTRNFFMCSSCHEVCFHDEQEAPDGTRLLISPDEQGRRPRLGGALGRAASSRASRTSPRRQLREPCGKVGIHFLDPRQENR